MDATRLPTGDDGALIWRVERQLSESEAVLWSVIVVASVFDVLTTMRGIALGFEEGNAVARAFIDTYGDPGIGLLKFVALVLLVVTWWVLPERSATLVLAGFAVISLLTIALNVITLAGL